MIVCVVKYSLLIKRIKFNSALFRIGLKPALVLTTMHMNLTILLAKAYIKFFTSKNKLKPFKNS